MKGPSYILCSRAIFSLDARTEGQHNSLRAPHDRTATFNKRSRGAQYARALAPERALFVSLIASFVFHDTRANVHESRDHEERLSCEGAQHGGRQRLSHEAEMAMLT